MNTDNTKETQETQETQEVQVQEAPDTVEATSAVPDATEDNKDPIAKQDLERSVAAVMQIPEVQELAKFFENRIKSLDADTTTNTFTKKLKRKQVVKDFQVVLVGIETLARVLVVLEKDETNPQTRADANKVGYVFANKCQEMHKKYGLIKHAPEQAKVPDHAWYYA